MSLWSSSLPADSSKLRVSAAYIRNNASALQLVLSLNTLSNGYAFIPTTAPVWFYANVAPSGWTLVAGTGDSLLAVVGGSSQYNATGGTQVGTWNGPSVALTYQQLPSTMPGDRGTATGTFFAVSNVSSQMITEGGATGQTHQHNYSTTRPAASLGIICSKNFP